MLSLPNYEILEVTYSKTDIEIVKYYLKELRKKYRPITKYFLYSYVLSLSLLSFIALALLLSGFFYVVFYSELTTYLKIPICLLNLIFVYFVFIVFKRYLYKKLDYYDSMQKLDLLLEDLDDLIIYMRDKKEYDIKKMYLAVTKKIFDMNGTLFFGANKSLMNSLLTKFGRQSLLYSLIVEDPSKINSLMEDSHIHQNWEYCCVIRDFKELSVF